MACIVVRTLNVVVVSQLSFFSAESVPPAVTDLTGVLAAAGQIVTVGDGARLSVVVDQAWRAEALGQMIDEAGLTAEITQTDEHTPLVRTDVDPRLRSMAGEWTRGAVKTDPAVVAARAARTAGLDSGRRQPGRRPLPIRTRPARAGHPLAAGVGTDARRDRADPDRHPRGPAGTANQRPPPAIAPGRERRGTA